MPRRLAPLLAVLALTLTTVSLAGCSSKAFNAADCAFHLYRAHHDATTGHHLLELYHIYEAAHHCPRAL